jgi:transcriptional regulator with XRE-family HTH domain
MNVSLLKELIRTHQSESPARSLQSIAQKAGIAEKTLRRILNDESRPSDKTVLSIAKAIFGRRSKDLFNFILEYKDGDLDRLREIFASCEVDLEQSEKLNRHIASSQVWYKVVALLTHERGVLQSQVERNLGIQGLKVLETLVDQGHALPLEKSRFKLSSKFVGQFDGGTLKNILTQCIQMYDLESFGTELSQIGHVQNWVDGEGRKQVRQALFELMAKVIDISKKHPGDIPITTMTSMISLVEDGIGGAQ